MKLLIKQFSPTSCHLCYFHFLLDLMISKNRCSFLPCFIKTD
jgi:hypothetical protein